MDLKRTSVSRHVSCFILPHIRAWIWSGGLF